MILPEATMETTMPDTTLTLVTALDVDALAPLVRPLDATPVAGDGVVQLVFPTEQYAEDARWVLDQLQSLVSSTLGAVRVRR